MIRTLSAIAIAALIAAAPFALSLIPYSEAGQPVALAKGGRLVADRGCANQTWPNFTASCLQGMAPDSSLAWSVPTAADYKRSIQLDRVFRQIGRQCSARTENEKVTT